MKIIKGMEFIKIRNFIGRMFVLRKISFAMIEMDQNERDFIDETIEFLIERTFVFLISSATNFIQNLIRHNTH